MGTPTAVTYANLFLYGIENSLILKHKPSYYKRYIDDIYSVFDNNGYILLTSSVKNNIQIR